jgi:hypothetical protein
LASALKSRDGAFHSQRRWFAKRQPVDHEQRSDEATLVVAMTGSGINLADAPDIALSATNLNFGNVVIGSSNTLTLTLSNVGASTLTVTSLTTNNSAFRVVSPATPFNVAAGAQVLVTVRFTPTFSGAQSATLSITNNDPDEATVVVALAGTGISLANGPDIALSATNLNFGTVRVGGSNDVTLTISNAGLNTLTITLLATNNSAFRVLSPSAPFDISARTQAVVTIRFSSTNSGTHTGAVSIASNDPDEAVVNVLVSGSVLADPPVITAISPTNAAAGSFVTIAGRELRHECNRCRRSVRRSCRRHPKHLRDSNRRSPAIGSERLRACRRDSGKSDKRRSPARRSDSAVVVAHHGCVAHGDGFSASAHAASVARARAIAFGICRLSVRALDERSEFQRQQRARRPGIFRAAQAVLRATILPCRRLCREGTAIHPRYFAEGKTCGQDNR